MNVKEMNEARELFNGEVANLEVAGYVKSGRTKEGILFEHETESDNYVVVKVIAKKEGFDAEDALAEYAEAVAKAQEKEKAHAEKVRKAKEKKDKEKKEE